ncbi:MAG TPA: helix-turn-helix domain-containing protein [Terriglobia bacterium]|nr:helix-turn-helix domain-containing protein [Terriglobia bacterium]
MRTYHRLRVHLPQPHRKELQALLRGGLQPVRVVLRALALLQLATGQTAAQVAANLDLTPKAVRQIGGRYRQRGLERALYDRPRPGAVPALDASQRQRIVAMVSSDPPEGYGRWTVRLIAQEAVKRQWVPKVGRETIRVLLQSHDLKPWRETNVVRR